MGPRWDERREAIAPRRIGVGIGGDVDALSASAVDFGDDFGHVPPGSLAGDFQVPDFYGYMRRARDLDDFVDRLQDRCTLTAHVRGIYASEAGGFGGERDQFFGLGVGSRRIFERSGDSNGAVQHGLADQLFHLLELRRVGLYIVVAEDHAADAGGADVIGDIDADALFFKACEVLAKSSPVGLHVELIEGALISTENGLVQRSDAFPFAGDFRGDALIDFRWQPRIDKNREFGLAKHVNEAGSDNQTVSVDGALARCCGQIADCGDLSFPNSDVTGIPR